MLAYRYRFHGHSSLRYLYRNGRNYRARHLALRCIANPQRPRPRVAVIVSKKVCKRAWGRNRIRRRVFEIVRHVLPQIPTSYDLSLTVFSAELLTLPHAELTQEVAELLAQARVIPSARSQEIEL